jgi:hypothetical protein
MLGFLVAEDELMDLKPLVKLQLDEQGHIKIHIIWRLKQIYVNKFKNRSLEKAI